jgi:Family of unknown function (DUF6982)
MELTWEGVIGRTPAPTRRRPAAGERRAEENKTPSATENEQQKNGTETQRPVGRVVGFREELPTKRAAAPTTGIAWRQGGTMKNLVVVKYLNGYIVRGHTLDIGNKDVFHLFTTTGEKQEVRIDELKAVFFVRSLTGGQHGEYVHPQTNALGAKLVVQFFDGEEIMGTSFDYSLKKTHFYLFPLDPEDNNERILINRKAARFISRVSDRRKKRRSPEEEVAFRKQFEREVYRFMYSIAQQCSDPRMQIDRQALVNFHLSFRKEFGVRFQEYLVVFGQKTWEEFRDLKLNEICLDMGDRSVVLLRKIMVLPKPKPKSEATTKSAPVKPAAATVH